MNVSQKAKFSTMFPTLSKDFSEMRKFQPKPLKPQYDIRLKSPNPEGFWLTLKTRGAILIFVERWWGVPTHHLCQRLHTRPLKRAPETVPEV